MVGLSLGKLPKRTVLSIIYRLKNIYTRMFTNQILIVGHDAHPYGAELILLHIIEVLFSKNYKVHLILLGDGPLWEEYKQHCSSVHIINKEDVPGKTDALLCHFRKIGVKTAITNTVISGILVKTLTKHSIRTLALVHEMAVSIKLHKATTWAREIAEFASTVIFPSKAVHRDFFRIVGDTLDENQVHIVHQGLYKRSALQQERELNESRTVLRKNLNLDEHAKIVLSVGSGTHIKGMDILIDAAISILCHNTSVYFVWLGSISEEMNSVIAAKITGTLYEKNFFFKGYESETDLYYGGADIFALPSREDSFPSVVMEALDSRTPVVAFSASGGAGDILSRGGGILVEPFSAQAFSAALASLLIDDEKVRNLGSEGKALIDDTYSFPEYVQRLMTLLENNNPVGSENSEKQ